jgi:glycosyltransferase involved in cell wall biosynthesis
MKACSALAELGHDVRLWTLGSDPELPWEDLAKHYGVKNRFAVKWIADFPWPRGWLYSLRAVRAARRWRADLYYVWSYQAAALASRKGLPTLLELHDRPHGRMGPILFRRFLSGGGARRVVITTKALLDWVRESYAQLLDPPSTIVAPNGVDLERYHNLPTAEEARILLDLPDPLLEEGLLLAHGIRLGNADIALYQHHQFVEQAGADGAPAGAAWPMLPEISRDERRFQEILRMLDSLQLTESAQVATPAD